MTLSPVNPDNPQAWQRFVENWTKKREKPYAIDIARSINAYAREVASNAEQGLPLFTGPIASGGHAEQVAQIMLKREDRTARQYATLVQSGVKSALGHERKDFETDFETWLQRYLSTVTATQIVRVSDQTREQVRQAVEIAQREGLGPAATARLIRERSRIIGAARALTIARTEVGMVASGANEASLDALTIQRRKRWVAALGERTRDTHRAADGQERAVNEAFDVGNAKLMRPLDPNGPPGEIINCRCVSIALTV